MKVFLPFLIGLCVMVGTPRAQGCGASEDVAAPLLPFDHAHDVPLNAVLISSSTFSDAIYEVRRVSEVDEETAGAAGAANSSDAGLAVPTEVTCRHHQHKSEGVLCFARAEFEPNATYEWAVASNSDGEGPDDASVPRWTTWRRFTTGDAPAMESQLGTVNVAVTRYEKFKNPLCGTRSSGTLALDGDALHQPAVVRVVEAVPNHVTQAIVLEPGARSEVNAYNVEGCYEVEAFDLLGNRTTMGDACFGSDSPAGCAVEGPTRTGSLWWAVSGGVVCLVMRRRMTGALRG